MPAKGKDDLQETTFHFIKDVKDREVDHLPSLTR